jgi:hypothetical protein
MSAACPTRSTPASCSAIPTPVTSVFSARQPLSVRTSVLAAPSSRGSGSTTCANSTAACLHGIVTEKPRHSSPRPARSTGRSAGPMSSAS